MTEAAAGMRRGRGFAPTVIAGACATLLGVGLQRFAYAPLVPAMVQARWLTASAAGLLGAANFLGYVLGGLAAAALARRLGMVRTLRGAMLLAAGCFALCAPTWGEAGGGLPWLAPWRVLAGIAGGALMVLAGPAIQAAVAPARRGLAAGVVFSGVGLGIVGGAAIVPAVLPAGISAVWLALATAGFALAAVSWPLWPHVPPPAPVPILRKLPPGAARLVASYALAAMAATPHMVWWPDFIARGLHRGTSAGAGSWLIYGLGALAGPSLCGRLADRVGAGRALRLVLGMQVAAIGAPLRSGNLVLLDIAGFGAGAAAVGITALTLTRARELAGDGAPSVWRLATISWGAAQVATGFLLVWLFAASGTHLALFALGTGAAAAALLLMRGAG
jgi:predicted MFS family arabinose efflux permease